jgi:hypothetical protein
MTSYTINHFQKVNAHASKASRFVVEAHNIRNAMRRLWDDHRVNLVNGDVISWEDGDRFHRLMISQ